MRKSCISLLLMLFAVAGWAQESKTEKKESILPITVEGSLENVPNGTVIMLRERYGKTCGYFSRGNEGTDTLRNGKFRIVYYPLTEVNPRKNVDEYSISAKYNGGNLNGHLEIYASLGTKASGRSSSLEKVIFSITPLSLNKARQLRHPASSLKL